jgi:abequosyltransferase
MARAYHNHLLVSSRIHVRPRPNSLTPMPAQRLTIIVPTYNRAEHLARLLATLASELAGLEGRVSVVIGDNCSTDKTPALTAEFTRSWQATQVLRHPSNLGADGNFCRCLEHAQSPYFWIIGDDDLPRAGFVRALVDLLDRAAPDMVYINSRWSPALADNEPGQPLRALDAVQIDRRTFARRVHVWTTFISGVVVRREFAAGPALRRFTGTSLVQLGWVLNALDRGERFVHVRSVGVLATSGNTGGYRVMQVFGSNFQRVTLEALSGSRMSRRMARAMIARTTLMFLPHLVWQFRLGTLGDFTAKEPLAEALSSQVRRSLAYGLLLQPIAQWPEPAARVVLKLADIAARTVAVWDGLMARTFGKLERM